MGKPKKVCSCPRNTKYNYFKSKQLFFLPVFFKVMVSVRELVCPVLSNDAVSVWGTKKGGQTSYIPLKAGVLDKRTMKAY